MPSSVHIDEFLKLSETNPVLDVRTPAEFLQGQISGAINFPLFTNEERKIVGTIYKQQGQKPAIIKGLELVGPKMHSFISDADKIKHSGIFLFHCWRGGMRSSSMAWLFETCGFKAITLKGGYKAYRNHVLKSFASPKKITILGGKTGSGKTLVLHELAKQDEQILDLEKIANHKGSSYGSFGEEKQKSQEQFENDLAGFFNKIDAGRNCWIEDESRKIGINVIPGALWDQMQKANVVHIELSTGERVNYLVREYGKFSREELITATERIGKKLGGQHVKRAVEAIESGDLKTACEISLVYYDKTYGYGLEQRKEKVKTFEFKKMDFEEIAKTIKNA
ncbi:MAG: tRNA 2-selenouridine(34) synthase MnmH [Bacteroidia bacterium]